MSRGPDTHAPVPPRVAGGGRVPASLGMANVPGPLPEALRKGVYEAYSRAEYNIFMRHIVALQESTMSREEVDAGVFSMLGFTGGKMDRGPFYQPFRDTTSKSHRPDLYRMFVEWSTAAPRVAGGGRVPASLGMANVPGPLPEALRKGVYEAYSRAEYNIFMRHIVALQESTMSREEVDAGVFSMLGFTGGKMDRDPGYQPFRDTTSKSHRPDLYRMFVEWSTAAPRVVGTKRKQDALFSFGVMKIPAAARRAPRLHALSAEVLVRDLIALDAAPAMSPTMQTALRTGAGASDEMLSRDAIRLLWQKELLQRVTTDEQATGDTAMRARFTPQQTWPAKPEPMPPDVFQAVAGQQQVLEQLADKVHHMEKLWGSACLFGTKRPVHARIDTTMPSV